MRRLPLFELWPSRRATRRRADRLEWCAWVGASLLVALAVPASTAAGVVARGALAATARHQRGSGAAAPMGDVEILTYAAGLGLAVLASCVAVAGGALWLLGRRLARLRDLEWTADWRAAAARWAAGSDEGGRTPGPG